VFGDFSFYDGGFHGVRLAAAPDGPRIYVVAWREDYGGGGFNQELSLSSSEDHGASWTPSKRIAFAYPETSELEDFALAAGRRANVLVAYGWGYWLQDNTFLDTLRVAKSTDHGASFTYVTADQYNSNDGSITLRDPDIEIGRRGTAHIVYRKNDYPTSVILYKYSLPPYGAWSTEPVRLNDAVPELELYDPNLALGRCGDTSVLHATWGTSASKVIYTRRVARPGYAWTDPLTVGELKGGQYGIFANGLAAAGPRAFSIFSGRTTPDPPGRWGIAGSRVWSGITCP
jgi:hypothetical protein